MIYSYSYNLIVILRGQVGFASEVEPESPYQRYEDDDEFGGGGGGYDDGDGGGGGGGGGGDGDGGDGEAHHLIPSNTP